MVRLDGVIDEALSAGQQPEEIVSVLQEQGIEDSNIIDQWPETTSCPLQPQDTEAEIGGDEASSTVTDGDTVSGSQPVENKAGVAENNEAMPETSGSSKSTDSASPTQKELDSDESHKRHEDPRQSQKAIDEDDTQDDANTKSTNQSKEEPVQHDPPGTESVDATEESSRAEPGDQDDEQSRSAEDQDSESEGDEDEYSREDDVLTQEDFDEIEDEEDEKGLVSTIASVFTSDDSESDAGDEDDEGRVDVLQRSELSRRLEKTEDSVEDVEVDMSKLDGRIDVLSEKQENTTQSIDRVREDLGELRSTVLGRERSFNQLQEDFRKIKLIVDNFDQDVLDKKFDTITTKQTKLESELERTQSQLEQTRDQLDEYQEVMKKIKDYDNLLSKLDEIKSKKKEISSMKVDAEKASSKAEVLVHNVQDSLKKMKEAHSVASTNKETIKDITKDVSTLEAKTEGLVKKETFDDLKDDVEVMKEALFNDEFKS